MADTGGDQRRDAGKMPSSADKLRRPHKRCCNERCRALLTLTAKHCKTCNTAQVERKPSTTSSGSGDDDAEGSKRSRKRKASDVSSASEDGPADDSDTAESETEEAEAHGNAAVAVRAGGDAELTNIAQATGYAIQQEQETLDQEPFDCAAGPDKPMMELQAGSQVYYQASIIRESLTEIRVLFPETKKMSERREWVDKRSSRIWRGRMESRYWRYIKGSDGGWEPKSVGEGGAAGGSFRRKGSAARSRGSAGRSRGTKQSTEDGNASEQRRRNAAAMDTAASPQPKAPRQQLGMRRRQPVDASSASSDAEGSDREQQASGVAAAASERRPRVWEAGDPLEAWFKVHYGLLRAAACLGAGLTPPSAETGKASAARRRSSTAQPRRRFKPLAGPQRNREQRQERRAAQPPSEPASSEDEGAALPSPRSGGNAAPGKAGRELKRLQMWAWERRRGSDSSDEDEGASGDGDAGSHDTAEEGSESGGRAKAGPATARQDAAPQQQHDVVQQQPKAPAKDGAAARTSADAQQPAGAGAAPPALAGKGVDGRVAPISTEAKQQRPKPGVAEPKQPQQARPRAPPKPLAVLEECDVFGKLPAPARKQPSGVVLPPSPRAAGGAEAGPGSGRQGPAAAGSQLQLPKQPGDLPVKAPAEAPAAPAAPVNGADASPRPQDAAAAARPSSPAGGQAVQSPLSPQKRRLAVHEGSGQGMAAAATACEPAPEAGRQKGGGEPPAKRQNVRGEDAGAAQAKSSIGLGDHLTGQAGT